MDSCLIIIFVYLFTHLFCLDCIYSFLKLLIFYSKKLINIIIFKRYFQQGYRQIPTWKISKLPEEIEIRSIPLIIPSVVLSVLRVRVPRSHPSSPRQCPRVYFKLLNAEVCSFTWCALKTCSCGSKNRYLVSVFFYHFILTVFRGTRRVSGSFIIFSFTCSWFASWVFFICGVLFGVLTDFFFIRCW